jgi:hypothetical protein
VFVRRAKDPDDRWRVIIEPFLERIERAIAPLFESVGNAMAELCARYSTREVAAIRDFLGRFIQSAYEETPKLWEGTEDPAPARGSKPTALSDSEPGPGESTATEDGFGPSPRLQVSDPPKSPPLPP